MKIIYEQNALPPSEKIIKISTLGENYNFKNYYVETTKKQYFLKINEKINNQCIVINKMYKDTRFNTLTKRDVYYSDEKIILMEYFHSKRFSNDFLNSRIIAEKIAHFHTEKRTHYGYKYDTYIGSLLQSNQQLKSWKEFFLNQRYDCLWSAIKKSMQIGSKLDNKILSVRDYINRNLKEPESPTLIHGDIWSGNILMNGNSSTQIKIIDPALFCADSEFELAYIYLNGTFGRSFYESYAYHRQITDEFWQFKLFIYQLIPLMQYTLLEGSLYLKEIEKILDFLIKRDNLKY